MKKTQKGSPQNAQRADRAAVALNAYCLSAGVSEPDLETVTDLLSDLMHWQYRRDPIGARDGAIDAILEAAHTAERHYSAELRESHI